MFPSQPAGADDNDQPGNEENQEGGKGKKKAAPRKKPKSKSKSPAPKKPHVAIAKNKVPPQAADPAAKRAEKQLADKELNKM